jgi:hypothetical protein
MRGGVPRPIVMLGGVAQNIRWGRRLWRRKVLEACILICRVPTRVRA